MWIIPKTLSAFVQDTEGLNLDLDERAWMLEQSAMWRSKPSSKQTWLRRLKKDAWMTRLSTRILKPSLHESFEEKFTASLEDIPVSPSVAQESEKERKTQDTYGPTSESMSGQLDLFGAFSKMSEVTPRWGYGESCPIWKKMVTERSSDCSVRRKQARLTNASDASSWPTVAASEARQGYQDRSRGKKGSQKSLTTIVVDNWSTPQARDWKGAQGRAYKGEAKDLPAQTEQNWATPNTMDYMETRSAEGVEKIASGARKGRKRPSNLREQVDKKTCDIYNQLNWPTPRAGNPGSRKPGTGGKILAEEAKKNWGTPASNDANKTPHCEINSKQGGLSKSVGIEEAKKNWPTPTAMSRPRSEETMEKCLKFRKSKGKNTVPLYLEEEIRIQEAKIHAGPPAPEKSSTSGKNHGSWPTPNTSDQYNPNIPHDVGRSYLRTESLPEDQRKPNPTMKLNPNWVEQLMGLPIGWTDLGSWATESSHKPQK